MAYSTTTRGRGNPRTRLAGTTHHNLLSFTTYVDKGSKKIMDNFGILCRETVKQAIMDGYNDAFIEAKKEVGMQLEDVDVFGMPAPTGVTQKFVDRASTSKYQGKQLTKHNRNRASSAEQRIWDSLGYTFLQDGRGSYVRAIAGSSDWNDAKTQFSGITAVSAPDANPRTTENRKPSGGFNLAKAYEIGVPAFKYNFRSSRQGFRGVTPTPTYSFDAKVGEVLLVKDARHPGFTPPGNDRKGIVERFHDAFKKHLDEKTLKHLRIAEFNNLNNSSGRVS
tara:strand:+ start:323 stop:1159 length:837 start_codon:yes stop_codon:yes gene_type:complete